ncbi:MAG: hypothetical protein WBA77_19525 [Microcoleaceae cyanobacterium]
MTDESQKPKNNRNQPEDSKELNDLAKAMMVHLTWSMAGMSEQKPSNRQKKHPPHSDN